MVVCFIFARNTDKTTNLNKSLTRYNYAGTYLNPTTMRLLPQYTANKGLVGSSMIFRLLKNHEVTVTVQLIGG
jgi:hypothetical protein